MCCRRLVYRSVLLQRACRYPGRPYTRYSLGELPYRQKWRCESARYTDTDPELWLRMQQARDLRLTADGMKKKLTGIVPIQRTAVKTAKLNPTLAKPATVRFTVKLGAKGSGTQQVYAAKSGRPTVASKSAGARTGKPLKTAR